MVSHDVRYSIARGGRWLASMGFEQPLLLLPAPTGSTGWCGRPVRAELDTPVQARLGPPHVPVQARGQVARYLSVHGDGEHPLGERSTRVGGTDYEREPLRREAAFTQTVA